MNIPVNVLTWASALLPIGVLLILLVGCRWPATRASAAATFTAFIVAFVIYKAPFGLLAYEASKGLWNSISIIAVTIPAILIYEISYEAGAFGAIQKHLTRLIPDTLLQILALGWCFTSFLQGPSGFGVPIAVTAPLLIGIGVKPLWAVIIPLMAHAWANTFGTLALGWDALIQQTSLVQGSVEYLQTAWWTSLFTGLLCIFAGVLICYFYQGIRGIKKGFLALVVLGSIQAGGQLLLSQYAPTLAVVIPTTIALGACFLLGKLPMYAIASDNIKSALMQDKQITTDSTSNLSLHEALLPYYILVGISILVLLTPPINTLLSTWKVSFAFPETSTGYGFVNKAITSYGQTTLFTHSGFFLLFAALSSAVYFAQKHVISKESVRRIIRNTFYKSLPASISVALLLAMSKLMSGSGQVDVLAHGTALATGVYYTLLAPLIGTLGSFMSSSNVSSNILFGQFQESMSTLTGKDPAVILAAQTSGGAVGTMFSPSKVLLGTTTAGIVGQEGQIIKKLFAIAGVATIGMGIIAYICS